MAERTHFLKLALKRGATTTNQRYLRVGIDHYDTSTTVEAVQVTHTGVGVAAA